MSWLNNDNRPEQPKPAGVTPVPEHVEGENIPYRGNVDHGVPIPHNENTDESHYWEGRPVEYEAEEKEPEPVPVKIVTSGDREIRQIRTNRFIIPQGQRVQIVGRDMTRKDFTIRNMDAAIPVYIGNPEVTQTTGFPIAGNATQQVTASGQVFAYVDAAAANPVEIALLINVGQEVK